MPLFKPVNVTLVADSLSNDYPVKEEVVVNNVLLTPFDTGRIDRMRSATSLDTGVGQLA